MVNTLQFLQTAVSPKVAAAVLRTLWNGWTTCHRFQGSGTCVFKCSHWAEDKLEHYAVCPHVHTFGRTMFNIRQKPSLNPSGLFLTLGLHESTVADADIVRRAIWVYATYRAVVELEHEEASSNVDIQELLK